VLPDMAHSFVASSPHVQTIPGRGFGFSRESWKSNFQNWEAMTDLNALVIFAKVVEAKSFSEAARRLRMPISTVSRRIAELEDQLGVRLLDRSTRALRLTDLGSEVLEHAQRSAEAGEAVESIVSNQHSNVTGMLRLSAPPNISDTLLSPLVTAFQASYPNVRVHILIAERYVDHIADGVDIVFRLGSLKDSSLVARRVLTYRHRLVASPDYLKNSNPPQAPQDLLSHRLIAFSYGRPDTRWTFVRVNGEDEETLTFQPHLSMNDFAGLTSALLAAGGIGDLPPVVQPELIRNGRLVEVMPQWRFRTHDLSLVHLGNRNMPRPVRLFKDFATSMAPTLFQDLPT
jgi:DNA-binding transcriptional LysR family regulator